MNADAECDSHRGRNGYRSVDCFPFRLEGRRCVVWLALYKADHTADMTQVQNAARKRKEILMGVVE